MQAPIVNYDGSISASPREHVFPETVADLQAILRDTARYPGPVRAKGSYHSLTPCASSDGTMVDMSRMTRVLDIDPLRRTFTAEAGLHFIDAARALRVQDLQFMTNVEIGNMTLGSAACCHTKDALDGVELGQVSSYVTGMKWVTPSGDLAEATTDTDLALLARMRSSHGLAGIVYEVTFQIKPIEALHFTYEPRPLDELTQEEVDSLLDGSEGIICWTVGKTCVFQRRQRISDPGIFGSLLSAARRTLWNRTEAHCAHFIDQFVTNKDLRASVQDGFFDVNKLLYSMLRMFGGISLLAPDKIVDYRGTPPSDRYAFTFWAFPRDKWLRTLCEYIEFADRYHAATGFRCNMPLGAYHIRRDTSSLLSYTYDGEIMSIDPIHASTDDAAWHAFLRAFNEFAHERGGVPLLNQSPFLTRAHMESAYGSRWRLHSEWVRSVDPTGRMLNPFFAELLSERSEGR